MEVWSGFLGLVCSFTCTLFNTQLFHPTFLLCLNSGAASLGGGGLLRRPNQIEIVWFPWSASSSSRPYCCYLATELKLSTMRMFVEHMYRWLLIGWVKAWYPSFGHRFYCLLEKHYCAKKPATGWPKRDPPVRAFISRRWKKTFAGRCDTILYQMETRKYSMPEVRHSYSLNCTS